MRGGVPVRAVQTGSRALSRVEVREPWERRKRWRRLHWTATSSLSVAGRLLSCGRARPCSASAPAPQAAVGGFLAHSGRRETARRQRTRGASHSVPSPLLPRGPPAPSRLRLELPWGARFSKKYANKKRCQILRETYT